MKVQFEYRFQQIDPPTYIKVKSHAILETFESKLIGDSNDGHILEIFKLIWQVISG
jgi:hypothetical protein